VRPVAVFVGVFAGVLVVLLAAVGQLGKIDLQTLVVVLILSAVAAGVVVWRAR
jgi:hypothetical protein